MASDIEPLGGDPTTGGMFIFEVDGVEIGTFREVRGLELTVDVETYTEGGQSQYVHKLPGTLHWPNLVFSRGMVESDALFTWVSNSAGEGFAANGNKLTRSTGAVTAVSCRNTPIAGPPLWYCPVECRKRGPHPKVTGRFALGPIPSRQ